MTSIYSGIRTTAALRYSEFQANAALRILADPTKVSSTQSDVDELVSIIRSATDGRFEIEAEFDGAVIDTTDENESDDPDIAIRSFHNAKISTGGGDDDIGTYDHSIVMAGAGDDRIQTYRNGVVSAGAGNDYVYGYSNMSVDAGDGDDEVRTSGYSNIDAGSGDDLVVTLGYSTVFGGEGNDTLIANDQSADHKDQAGFATLYGGDGDDDIQIGRNSIANGGRGNDTITLVREGSTVQYANGDGRDEVFAEDDFSIVVSGYSKENLAYHVEGSKLMVSFAGSDDGMVITLREGKAVTLSFDDGSEVAIGGANDGQTFSVKWTSPEWRSVEDYREVRHTSAVPNYFVANEK